jgi:hypothetical protein
VNGARLGIGTVAGARKMNEIAGKTRRRSAVTLIEAVLFISIALAVIVGGLVFYAQASLAMKVMNVKRHVQAAIVETRAIQDQTHAWSFPAWPGRATSTDCAESLWCPARQCPGGSGIWISDTKLT